MLASNEPCTERHTNGHPDQKAPTTCAVKEGKKESILVYVASGPYMKTKKDGTRELEYCNAFIKLK